jgi:hypothetical protein
MSMKGRLTLVVALFLVGVGLVVLSVAVFLKPGTPGGVTNFTKSQAPGQTVHLTAQTVGSIGFGPHPTWVSYMVKNPTTGKWVQDTTWELPAHTKIDVTIEQFDSGSPIRNQEWGQVQGTIGRSMTLNGKKVSVYNSYTGNGIGHTFAVPTLGISVPLVGVSPTASNVCGEGPCSLKLPHEIIKFSFMTPGPGNYPWQCFVPCGLGFLYGNGGPMSTQNYMGGFLDVVSS